MAFPSVLSVTRTTTNRNTATTSHVVATPVLSAGDRLVLIFANAGTVNPSDPTNWTRPTNGSGVCNVSGGENRTTVFYRDFASGQGASTVTVTTGSSVKSDSQVYLLDAGTFDSGTGLAAANSADTGGGIDADPPNLAPSWGAEDTLWLAVATGRDHGNNAWTAPTNYTNLQGAQETTGSDEVEVWSARRNLNASSENPGQFNAPFSEWWSALTVAVRPAGADDPANLQASVLGSDVTLTWDV